MFYYHVFIKQKKRGWIDKDIYIYIYILRSLYCTNVQSFSKIIFIYFQNILKKLLEKLLRCLKDNIV